MSLAAVFVVMCALGMATPLPIPVSPVPMSPVNTTVLQCITNVQSTVQSSLLWANRLVLTYGAVLVPQPSCFELQLSPSDIPDASIINYLPRLQQDIATAIFNQYYLGLVLESTLSHNASNDLTYVTILSDTARNLNTTILTLNNLIAMLQPFVPATSLVVVKGTQTATTSPTAAKGTVTLATSNQNCYSVDFNQQYITAVRLQGVLENYLYQDLLKVQTVLNRIQ